MQLFGMPKMRGKESLPKGWKKVESKSRPGQFSYENTATKQRYDKIPGAPT